MEQHRVTSRTKARRRAVDVLFEADQRGEYTPDGLRTLLSERIDLSAAQTPLPAYSRQIVAGVSQDCAAIDRILSSYIQGWALDRLPAVDRAILRMAVWELFRNDEVDAPVSIAEAATLAAQLSTDDSPGFINAVLDRLRQLGPAVAAEFDSQMD